MNGFPLTSLRQQINTAYLDYILRMATAVADLDFLRMLKATYMRKTISYYHFFMHSQLTSEDREVAFCFVP